MTITITNEIRNILPPTADDEYTPEQRSVVDAQIAEGLADVKAGRVHGPFETHQEMLKFLHTRARKAKPQKSSRKTR